MAKIHLAHSPDSDDAFMFYAMTAGKIDTGDREYVHELGDIESLNKRALEGELEVSACSIHAYAYLQENYFLMRSGASAGEDYGPVLVAKEELTLDDLKGKQIAVPGLKTSAYLTMKLCFPDFEPVPVPFDEIEQRVLDGDFPAGLLIHEGQLTHPELGLKCIVDLGKWWKEETGLPLPLGGNIVRKDLGKELADKIAEDVQSSVKWALDNRKEALEFAMEYGRGLDAELVDRFVEMYVNNRTVDWGNDGEKAIRLLLERGHDKGLIPHKTVIDFVPSQ
jgi:1,4-dihydroxy-6-naphthoate synthase